MERVTNFEFDYKGYQKSGERFHGSQKDWNQLFMVRIHQITLDDNLNHKNSHIECPEKYRSIIEDLEYYWDGHLHSSDQDTKLPVKFVDSEKKSIDVCGIPVNVLNF